MQSDIDSEVQMSNLVRMNLNVSIGVPEKLREMAGSKFKMGSWLSTVIENMYEAKGTDNTVHSMEMEGMRLMVLGMGGQLQALRGEVAHLQAQLAALIAKQG